MSYVLLVLSIFRKDRTVSKILKSISFKLCICHFRIGNFKYTIIINMRRPSKLQDHVWFVLEEVPVPIPTDVDFTDYLWMADELEEFDRQVVSYVLYR